MIASPKADNNLYIKFGGVLTCIISLVLGLIELTTASREFVAFVPYPIGHLAVYLAGLLASNKHAATDIAYAIYIGLWIGHITIFALSYWITLQEGSARKRVGLPLLLTIQLLMAVSGQKPLLYLFSFEVGFLISWRHAAAWLVLAILLCIGVDYGLLERGGELRLSSGFPEMALNLGYLTLYLSMHFLVGIVASSDRSQRSQVHVAQLALAQSTAELLATQILFSESTRSSERSRIAREIHDSLGHSLMAQLLHLNLAARQSGPEPAGDIDSARILSQEIIDEIRFLVRRETDLAALTLEQVMRTFAQDVATPRIRIVLGRDTTANRSPANAVVLDCAKEVILDAVRYTAAVNVLIEVGLHGDRLKLAFFGSGHYLDKSDAENMFAAASATVSRLQGTIRTNLDEAGSFTVEIEFDVEKDSQGNIQIGNRHAKGSLIEVDKPLQ